MCSGFRLLFSFSIFVPIPRISRCLGEILLFGSAFTSVNAQHLSQKSNYIELPENSHSEMVFDDLEQAANVAYVTIITSKVICLSSTPHGIGNSTLSKKLPIAIEHYPDQIVQYVMQLPKAIQMVPLLSQNSFLRCDIATDPEQLCSVLLGVWNMFVPGLIMRMIGDADSTPNIKLEKELLKGISEAALASGTPKR